MRILFITLILLLQFGLAIFAQENNTKVIIVTGDKNLDEIISTFNAKTDSALQVTLKKPYPRFTAISLTGDTVTERDLLGKVTFIDFWFSSCSPCIAAFGDIEKLYNELKNDHRFQFISFCTDPVERVTESVRKYQLPYPVYPIKREQFPTLLVKGFPVNLIVNQQGKIIHYKSVGSTDMEDIEQIIKNVLRK